MSWHWCYWQAYMTNVPRDHASRDERNTIWAISCHYNNVYLISNLTRITTTTALFGFRRHHYFLQPYNSDGHAAVSSSINKKACMNEKRKIKLPKLEAKLYICYKFWLEISKTHLWIFMLWAAPSPTPVAPSATVSASSSSTPEKWAAMLHLHEWME